MLFDETILIRERRADIESLGPSLIRSAIAGLLSKRARSEFTKQVKQLSVRTKPRAGLFD